MGRQMGKGYECGYQIGLRIGRAESRRKAFEEAAEWHREMAIESSTIDLQDAHREYEFHFRQLAKGGGDAPEGQSHDR